MDNSGYVVCYLDSTDVFSRQATKDKALFDALLIKGDIMKLDSDTVITCAYCSNEFEGQYGDWECSSCGQLFCEYHLSDQCGCKDDGSGQYVVDLPDYYCQDCHMAYHADPREEWYEV